MKSRPAHAWFVLQLALSMQGCEGAPRAEVSSQDAAAGVDAATLLDAAVGRDAGPDAGRVDGDAAAGVDANVATSDAAMPGQDAAVPMLEAGLPSDAAPVRDATTLGDAGTRYASQPIAQPPSYLGTSAGSSACTQMMRTSGFAPSAQPGARFPLFLYFVGTSGGPSDESSRYDCQAGQKVTEAMARRGFVALSVEYDNALLSILTNKLDCLYAPSNAGSLLAKACALPSVDCALGIATWGHSQGALLAHAAHNYDPRHRASWTTGYSGMEIASLPVERLRVVNAENDTMNASVATLNKAAGMSAGSCPDDGRSQCLRADGSGWMLVRKAECRSNAADHCWFDKLSCVDGKETLEPAWIEPGSPTRFALEPNADWVAATVARAAP